MTARVAIENGYGLACLGLGLRLDFLVIVVYGALCGFEMLVFSGVVAYFPRLYVWQVSRYGTVWYADAHVWLLHTGLLIIMRCAISGALAVSRPKRLGWAVVALQAERANAIVG